MDIKAAVTHELGKDFRLETVQLAQPEFDEVQVRIVTTGVCHTDVVARDLGIAPCVTPLMSLTLAVRWMMVAVA